MLFITEARILDPSRSEEFEGDILIDGGKIIRIDRRWLKPNPAPRGARVIHAHGAYCVPSFWDIHVHLREPGQTHKETLATGAASAVAGGIGLVLAMPNTRPPIDNPQRLARLRKKARGLRATVKIALAGAVSQSQMGQKAAPMKQMAAGGAAAFSDDGFPIRTESLLRQALEISEKTGLVVIDHCEDLSLSADGVIRDGAVSRRLGLRGIPGAAESVWVARDIEILRTSPGRLHLAHISTKESVALIRRAKASGLRDRLTCEACPHHFSLTDEAVFERRANAKMNPPLGSREDVEAIKEALAEGVIDVIASDHAPHAPKEKSLSLAKVPFGVIGMETVFPVTMTFLVRPGILSFRRAIELLTVGPARVLGRNPPSIALGEPANLTIVDPQAPIMLTRLKSKSRNSPFLKAPLYGRVSMTIHQGRIVFGT